MVNPGQIHVKTIISYILVENCMFTTGGKANKQAQMPINVTKQEAHQQLALCNLTHPVLHHHLSHLLPY